MKKISFLCLIFLCLCLYGEYVPKDKALKILKEVTTHDFPKSDEVYINNEMTKLDKHCLGYVVTEKYRKILNDNARKDNSVRFGYNIDYQKVEVESIELIKPDGKIIPFDPGKILKEKDDTSMGWMNIYSDLLKVLIGELPDVQIGDIIYTKWKTVLKKAFMENNHFGYFGIEDYAPSLNKYKEITLPKKIKLYVHDLNNKGLKYEHSTEKKRGNIIYKWNVSKLPIIVNEPNIEGHFLFAHHIILTTIKTWEDISRWYYKIVKSHMKPSKEMKAKVKELIKGAKTRKEKLSRIFYWTANSIRYLGVDREKYRPYLEPHDVSYTFETRGGVCRDKAALLTAMFRLARIKSDVILISAGSRLNFEAPVLWFNHAITVSYDEKGDPEYIFDPTNENTKDFLPKYEEDNTYLIARKTGDTLRLAPVSPPAKNNSTLNIKLKVDENGNAKGFMEFLFSGFADTALRGYLAWMSPYEKKNLASGIVKLLHGNTGLIDFKCSDPKNKKRDMKISTNIEIKNFVSVINGMVFIPFNAPNLKMHILYNYIMNPFNLSSRKYDFKMAGAFSLDTNFEIEFSSDLLSHSVPKIEPLDYEDFKTTIKSSIDKNKIIVNYHFETTKIHFKQEQFLPIKEKIAGLFKNDNLYIIGKSGGHDE